jgi:hypothetical protein
MDDRAQPSDDPLIKKKWTKTSGNGTEDQPEISRTVHPNSKATLNPSQLKIFDPITNFLVSSNQRWGNPPLNNQRFPLVGGYDGWERLRA